MGAASFRAVRPTLFWNLVLYFREHALPLDFLIEREPDFAIVEEFRL